MHNSSENRHKKPEPWQYKNKPLFTGNKNNCRYDNDSDNRNKANLMTPTFAQSTSSLIHYSTHPFSGDSNSISAITCPSRLNRHKSKVNCFRPKLNSSPMLASTPPYEDVKTHFSVLHINLDSNEVDTAPFARAATLAILL